MKSVMADFACPQTIKSWEDNLENGNGFTLVPSPCCSSIQWDDGNNIKTWTMTNSVNEEYPIYSNTDGNFMWWMWHGKVGHWVVNK